MLERLASLRELQSVTGEELSALLPSVLDRVIVNPARIETQSKDWLGARLDYYIDTFQMLIENQVRKVERLQSGTQGCTLRIFFIGLLISISLWVRMFPHSPHFHTR